MIEFITDNADTIISYFAIVLTASPFLISRVVSDKNMLATFGDVKEMAGKISFKEFDINKSLEKIDQVTVDLNRKIKTMQKDYNENLKKIDKTILAFSEGDLFTKMLMGLEQLDKMNQLLQQKDGTIQDLKVVIKDINLKLGVIKNDRKL